MFKIDQNPSNKGESQEEIKIAAQYDHNNLLIPVNGVSHYVEPSSNLILNQGVHSSGNQQKLGTQSG